jgi:hypothetical protein
MDNRVLLRQQRKCSPIKTSGVAMKDGEPQEFEDACPPAAKRTVRSVEEPWPPGRQKSLFGDCALPAGLRTQQAGDRAQSAKWLPTRIVPAGAARMRDQARVGSISLLRCNPQPTGLSLARAVNYLWRSCRIKGALSPSGGNDAANRSSSFLTSPSLLRRSASAASVCRV